MQLDLFRDWVPRPAPPAAPPRRPPPGRLAELSTDAAVHVTPDPRRVYALSVSHGFDACLGRWYWLPRSGVSRLISQGRALVVGARSERCRRRLSPDQETAVVASVYALGGVLYAARVHGLDESLVRTLLRERGLTDYPRASTGRRAA